MNKLVETLRELFFRTTPADRVVAAEKGNDWQAESLKSEQRYIDTMLRRIEEYSRENAGDIDVPDSLYHASLKKGLTHLAPTLGQGLGVWFQEDLVESSHFAVSRSHDPMTSEPYPDADPSIYEVHLNVEKFAVFPNEISLYGLSIPQDGDENDNDLNFPPGRFSDLHEVRKVLEGAGYDGIYLQAEDTFSVIKADAIKIVREHDPVPIFNEHVRPKLSNRFGEDPFPFVPE